MEQVCRRSAGFSPGGIDSHRAAKRDATAAGLLRWTRCAADPDRFEAEPNPLVVGAILFKWPAYNGDVSSDRDFVVVEGVGLEQAAAGQTQPFVRVETPVDANGLRLKAVEGGRPLAQFGHVAPSHGDKIGKAGAGRSGKA